MRKKLWPAGAAALVAALAGAGGIAYAVGGSEEQVTGPEADRAAKAALEAAGGGTVVEVERQDGDGAGAYEVELRRPDGSQVEIHLDEGFRPVSTATDDEEGPEDESPDEDGASS